MTHLSHNLLEFMALQDSFPLITLLLASLLAAYFGIKISLVPRSILCKFRIINCTWSPNVKGQGHNQNTAEGGKSLYFTAVMMDTKGGRKIFPHCKIVECAQTKNIFIARRKINFFPPQFSTTKEIQVNLAGNICMTDWRLPLFGS